MGGSAARLNTERMLSHRILTVDIILTEDAGKIALHIRSILADLNVPRCDATIIFEDDRGALLMANSGQPTKYTKLIYMRYFVLQEWVEKDLIFIQYIPTSLNCADSLTKSNSHILFHRHFDFLLGRIPPVLSHAYFFVSLPYTG